MGSISRGGWHVVLLHTHQVAVILDRNSRRRQKIMKAFNVESHNRNVQK